MKRQILFFGALILMLSVTSCKKEENKTDEPTPTPTPTGFTPPTTNYWKINDVLNAESADAFHVNLAATLASVSKPFSSTYGYCNLSFGRNDGYSNDSIYREIRSKIPVGGYKEFYLTTKKEVGYEPNGDSLSLNITVQENADYYYYICQGGKVYISNKDNKLRFTTKGAINMIGVKNGAISNYIYTKTVDFSWEEL